MPGELNPQEQQFAFPQEGIGPEEEFKMRALDHGKNVENKAWHRVATFFSLGGLGFGLYKLADALFSIQSSNPILPELAGAGAVGLLWAAFHSVSSIFNAEGKNERETAKSERKLVKLATARG